ncbi:MAG: hypothetical protein IMZ58_12270 [Thermoplasmata archaeon]|nr:hypothetical protein [Thermoplasmata archaeon]
MNKKTITLILIFLAISTSLLQPIGADCPCPQGKTCFDVTVYVQGSENYTVHDELVIIRQKINNTNATRIICENRTNDEGTAHFSLENGTYWIDVRNIWVELTFDDDVDFTFPYKLFKDLPGNETNNDSTNPKDYPANSAVIAGATIVIFFIFVILVILIKKKKNK